MGRLIVLLLVLFAAPMAVWFGVRLWRARKNIAGQTLESPQAQEALREAPWTWLVTIGLVLAVIAVLAFGILDQRDCMPVPTQMIDGKLVPAHCK